MKPPLNDGNNARWSGLADSKYDNSSVRLKSVKLSVPPMKMVLRFSGPNPFASVDSAIASLYSSKVSTSIVVGIVGTLDGALDGLGDTDGVADGNKEGRLDGVVEGELDGLGDSDGVAEGDAWMLLRIQDLMSPSPAKIRTKDKGSKEKVRRNRAQNITKHMVQCHV